ncbi:hypothetical protein [Nitratireductor soli]|uniref:hypothetical protein n=1 Tax=Nitratireductor soli TaxID=1670619 RepID=UPI00065E048C|nr:hypothetical protein [Nitratireductor soli]
MARRVLSPMQQEFAKNMLRTGDKIYSAEKAGYKTPLVDGYKLMKNELIANAIRSEARKFLDEKAGPAAVYNLASIMLDEKQPTGARVKASEIIGKWSGMAGDDNAGGKEPHEMTGDELRAHIAKMERQQDAMKRALADQARPVLEGSTLDEVEPDDSSGSGVFD